MRNVALLQAARQLGSRERSLIAEAVFFALRRYGSLRWMMQPAHPERAARLAALITWHGRRRRCARSAARCATMSARAACARQASRSGAAARSASEVRLAVPGRVGDQYQDANALLASMIEAAPLDLRVNTSARSAMKSAELRAPRGSTRRCTRAHPYSPDGIRLFEKPA